MGEDKKSLTMAVSISDCKSQRIERLDMTAGGVASKSVDVVLELATLVLRKLYNLYVIEDLNLQANCHLSLCFQSVRGQSQE